MKFQTRLRLFVCLGFYILGYAMMTRPISVGQAAPGDLDTTFGVDHDGDGVLDGYNLYEGAASYGLTYLSNGNIFIVGAGGCSSTSSFAGYLSRSSALGVLDETFGDTGYLTYDYDLDGTFDEAGQVNAIVKDSDDNLYVTGSVLPNQGEYPTLDDNILFVAKYDADGVEDESFHANAMYDSTYGDESGNDLVLDSSGRVIVVGKSYASVSNVDSFLGIFESTGVATLTTPFVLSGTGKDEFNAVALDYYDDTGDYDIIAVGYLNDTGSNKEISVARFTSAGAYDTNFDSDGYLSKDYLNDTTGDDVAEDVAIDGNSNIFVTGYVTNAAGDTDAFVAKYTSAGAIDPSFGTDGYAVFDSGFGDDVATTIALDSQGGILIGGSMSLEETTPFFIARYTSAGLLDTGFGDANGDTKTGYVNISMIETNETQRINDLLLDADENILALGIVDELGLWTSGNDQVFLAKFEGGYDAAATAVCGNSTTETGETCDDGNLTDGDGCSATCQNEGTATGECGDGNLDSGEECDDGNLTADSTCSATCTTPVDADGDGYYDTADCDDSDASVFENCVTPAESEDSGGGGCGCVISRRGDNSVEAGLYGVAIAGLVLLRLRKRVKSLV